VLDESRGGLGVALWANTDLSLVEKLLPLLPAPQSSRSAFRLEQRLLLSAAAAPTGPAGTEPLIKLRADKLWALGDTQGLAALLKTVPTAALSPALRRLQIDVALLNDDGVSACAQAPALAATDSADFYPLKLQAFCQLSAGKMAEAGLTIDLVRDQKPADAAFFAAADLLRGLGGGRPEAYATLSPLTLAMARAAHVTLPDSAAATPIAGLWRALADTPSLSLEARILVAEKGENAGIVGLDEVRDLYTQLPYAPQDVAVTATSKLPPKTGRGRALLFRAIGEQFEAAPQATMIARALAMVDGQPGYFATARLYAPTVAAIPQTPDLAWFAVPAARALFAAGNTDGAMGWVLLARVAAAEDPSSTAATALWPLASLAAPGNGAPPALPADSYGSASPANSYGSASPANANTPASAAAWLKSQNLADPVARRRAALLYGLLTALGDAGRPSDWYALFDGPPVVTAKIAAPAYRFALEAAVHGQRKGETVLAVLDGLGDLSQADPVDLGRAVAALRDVGLGTEARALAVEAALANGL
jgi:hypothetical protein